MIFYLVLQISKYHQYFTIERCVIVCTVADLVAQVLLQMQSGNQ